MSRLEDQLGNGPSQMTAHQPRSALFSLKINPVCEYPRIPSPRHLEGYALVRATKPPKVGRVTRDRPALRTVGDPTTAGLAAARTVCLCMASIGGDSPLMPRTARRVGRDVVVSRPW
jgi:hypothetical protein